MCHCRRPLSDNLWTGASLLLLKDLPNQTDDHVSSVATIRRNLEVSSGIWGHVMPHFLGQGLGSGIRDAMALGWRLDLICVGLLRETLLDS